MKTAKLFRKQVAILLAVLLTLTTMVSPALALSSSAMKDIQGKAESMAKNSAAWWTAHWAQEEYEKEGKTDEVEKCKKTKKKLHKANEDISDYLEEKYGATSTYDEATGSWKIEIPGGPTIVSGSYLTDPDESGSSDDSDDSDASPGGGGSGGGKKKEATYELEWPDGTVETISKSAFDEAIEALFEKNGNDSDMLIAGYNYVANLVEVNGDYGTEEDQRSARYEAAVAQAVLGLTDKEADELKAKIEEYKKQWVDANKALEANPDMSEEEKQKYEDIKDKANDEAEKLRAQYGYTANNSDHPDWGDGGYYNPDSSPSPSTTSDDSFWYQVKVIVGPNGTVSDGDKNTITSEKAKTFYFLKGSTVSFSITPDSGYIVDKILLNGVSTSAYSSYTSVYVLKVDKNYTLNVTFKGGHTIMASCNKGGSITPAGKNKVDNGADATYEIEPLGGYKLASVTVDGKEVTVGGSNPTDVILVKSGNDTYYTYTFKSVSEDHTITASFEPEPKPDTPTIKSDTASKDGTIKAGYGFTLNWVINTEGCDEVRDVKATYNFGEGQREVLLDNLDGVFCFPENETSKLNQKPRKIYIPVDTADNVRPGYKIELSATVVYSDENGNEILKTVESECYIRVKGTMYEDDFTGDR